MTNLVRWLFSTTLTIVLAAFFGRFLGSEGATLLLTGRNIVGFSILLLSCIFLFHCFSFRLKKKFGVRRVGFMYFVLLFLSLLLGSLIRIYVYSRVGLDLTWLFPFLFLITIPPLDPSGSVSCGMAFDNPPRLEGGWTPPSAIPSGQELNLELELSLRQPGAGPSEIRETPPGNNAGVARNEAGPAHQLPFNQNGSLEMSLRNRITALDQAKSPFLYKEEGQVAFHTIKNALDQADSQEEYNRILAFENRDLQIRERKQDCYILFQEILSTNPNLAEKACYNPQEALEDFFFKERAQLDMQYKSNIPKQDEEELKQINAVYADFMQKDPNSEKIREILGFD